MSTEFFSYIERLETLGFFSAYPLCYALLYFIAANSKHAFVKKFLTLLPYSYAVVGLLYAGLQIRNLYPDYSVENIKLSFQQPLLKTWALLSIAFFIPSLARRPLLSLLHSLVFFFFLVKDLFSATATKNDLIKNDMKLFTDSLLVNLFAFGLVALISFLLHIRKQRSTLN
jgi:hypothetical protein